ncbi:type ISP restriction/modification enzyme [Hymenobacter mellowenesis]|uniref:type ISP restriction/modification enzyme n=1 Tax=Hymenobacter mellowenesis TaxID=3063995 RepID=UPI003F7A0A08
MALFEDDVITGIPEAAWRYRLGNRSALEWVLDQYKERTPKDPTIRAHFDTYRFADHVEQVADLLARVCTVSVQTMEIVDALAAQSPLKPSA